MSGNAYTVLIEGAGFQNRGAWLMLEAAVAAVRKFAPGAVVALANGIYESNRVWCRQHEVRPMYDSSSKGGRFLWNLYRMLGKIMHCPMPASEQDIDLLLDAAGYKYTDKFGNLSEAAILRQVAHYRRIASHGGMIVLLPQAFGPISDETIIRLYSESEKYLSQVYARDAESEKAIRTVAENKEIISLSPDFTCLYKVHNAPLARFHLARKYAVVVPNIRMITHVKKEDADKYRIFIASMVDALVSKDLQVVLLNHGGKEDVGLIEEVKKNSRLHDKIVCVNDASAAECKAIISKAKLLMSSRFHGVVSGLVQSVPTFCTSWSHKYEQLLADYCLQSNRLNVGDVQDSIAKLLDALESPGRYIASEGQLDEVVYKVNIMWKKIFKDATLHFSSVSKAAPYGVALRWRVVDFFLRSCILSPLKAIKRVVGC